MQHFLGENIVEYKKKCNFVEETYGTMRKLLYLLLFFPFFSLQAQEKNLKGFGRALELMLDTAATSFEKNIRYQEFLDKNVKPLNMEVFQVLEDTDSISYSLVKIYKDSRYDYNVAHLETRNEVVFEGKEYENEKCFLAGTYTYETKAGEIKIVPYYMTIDAFCAKAMDLFTEIFRIKESMSKEEE
jgi:hypothetical protein